MPFLRQVDDNAISLSGHCNTEGPDWSDGDAAHPKMC